MTETIHFGTAGIRGSTNIELTPELALAIARAYTQLLGHKGKVLLGMDTRYGSRMLLEACSSGLASGGISPVDCGILPTPALCVCTVQTQAAGAIMITGSHTHWDRNGILLIDSNGACLDLEKTRRVEELMNNPKGDSSVLPENIGVHRVYPGALTTYRDHLREHIDLKTISNHGFRVVVDPANGTAAILLGNVLEAMEVRVDRVNDRPDPKPDRPSEPRKHTLLTASRMTSERGCDLGVGLDVDADRAVFIDELGNVVSEDVIGALFAKYLLNHGQKVVTPVNSSGLIISTCKENKLEHLFCRIGQAEISNSLLLNDGDFAYEESGKYFFMDIGPWCDGLMSTIRLLEIIARENVSLSKLVSEFPGYYQAKQSLEHEKEGIEMIFGLACSKVKEFDAFSNSKGCLITRHSDLDGLKFHFEGDAWLLIRPSGTEQVLRVYSDARTKSMSKKLVDIGIDWIRKLQGETD